jgi:Rrf2 family protein
MRLSTRSRYGVRMMLALAARGGSSPIFLKDIARGEDISEKYLSQIIIPLKAHGLVHTFRGAHGGYILGRPASDITLREIIEPLEGDLGFVDCVTNSAVCGRSTECVTRGIWSEMSARMIDYLESVTLGELVKKQAHAAGTTAGADFSI